ncbi:alpha/beta hydrolase [Enterococcus sp. HY326]|uniref:alpha/beta hydrolase n=1 Tax=Enterococcus sp. HY326 TaxID=2971265 RepID=UPI00223F3B26|nr:alpha/beta hydrolase [Enterococcus sp. HY326]
MKIKWRRRHIASTLAMFLAMVILAGCSQTTENSSANSTSSSSHATSSTVVEETSESIEMSTTSSSAPTIVPPYNLDTRVQDVMNDSTFADYGRLIFPADRQISDTLQLRDVGTILTWYNNVNADKTVEITNYLYEQAAKGEKIFFDIYSDEEKQQDPAKNNTGIFFFRGNPNEKVAVLNAGGGFSYVAAMHDSFPHALELSRQGYNAFALIYRPGAQTASEDLARAIVFIHENAEDLAVDVTDYSLWGGSAGARMSAWLGSNGTESYGEDSYPRPAAVVMQYTGLSQITGNEPPTYANVGTNDGIANYRTVENYISRIASQGADTEVEVFDGLNHGFGLGQGTVAEGWLDNAVSFWERNS